MPSIQIRPFQRADREQLTKLVTAHIAAVLPGVSVSVNTVMSQLEREPAEAIVDPWVSERRVRERRDRRWSPPAAIRARSACQRLLPRCWRGPLARRAPRRDWRERRAARRLRRGHGRLRVARQYAMARCPRSPLMACPPAGRTSKIFTPAPVSCATAGLRSSSSRLSISIRHQRADRGPGAAPKRRRLRDAILCRARRDGRGDDRSRERRDRRRYVLSPERLERHRQPPRDRATPPPRSRNVASRARSGLAAPRQGRAPHRLRRTRGTRRTRLPRGAGFRELTRTERGWTYGRLSS